MRERERDRDRDRETERDRDRERQRERERQRDPREQIGTIIAGPVNRAKMHEAKTKSPTTTDSLDLHLARGILPSSKA